MISFFGLARGFLSGKYRSVADLGKSKARGSGVKDYLNPRGLRILDALDSVGARYGVAPASIAIAWLIARPSITAPITSATSIAQLKDLLAAATLDLDRDALAALDEASGHYA